MSAVFYLTGETHASIAAYQDTGLPIAQSLEMYPMTHVTSVGRWDTGQVIAVGTEGFESYSISNLLYSA